MNIFESLYTYITFYMLFNSKASQSFHHTSARIFNEWLNELQIIEFYRYFKKSNNNSFMLQFFNTLLIETHNEN